MLCACDPPGSQVSKRCSSCRKQCRQSCSLCICSALTCQRAVTSAALLASLGPHVLSDASGFLETSDFATTGVVSPNQLVQGPNSHQNVPAPHLPFHSRHPFVKIAVKIFQRSVYLSAQRNVFWKKGRPTGQHKIVYISYITRMKEAQGQLTTSVSPGIGCLG